MGFLENLEARRLLSSTAGDLDPTFGSDGHVSAPELAFSDGSSIVPASTGRFLLIDGAGLSEIEADGSPVTSFTPAATAFALPRGAIVQPDGKILLWGFLQSLDGFHTLERLNVDGSVDSSFGQQGLVNLQSALGVTVVQSVVVQQSSGKIVLLASDADHAVSLLRRLNADGSPDPTFQDPDSAVGIPIDAHALLGQSDDKLLVGGNLSVGQDSGAIVRLNADGTRDLSFGDNGVIAQAIAGVPVEFALVPGGADDFMAVNTIGTVRRFSAAGAIDQSFDAPTGLPFDPNLHILAAPGGKWVIYSEFSMTRLNADGSRDQLFGRLRADFFSPNFNGAAIDAQGNILIASAHIIHNIDQKGVYRLLGAAGPGESPITLAGSTLAITGTNDGDDIQAYSTVVSSGPAIAAVVEGQLGRFFDPDQVEHITVMGQGGNDLVQILAAIPSSLSGGDGSDTLTGGDANDSLSGNAGPDFLEGGNGNDRLAGNGGKDIIGGGAGDDFILGGAGKDRMAGEGGNDLLEGGSGDDFLLGGAGLDTFAGGAGDDRFIGEDGLAESIFGDAGNDLAIPNELDILSSIEGELPRG